MREAAFARNGEMLVHPLTLEIEEGARIARCFASSREAAIVALMAYGGVKATGGAVFVDGFDPKLQPTQCKQIAGYVPHDLVPMEFSTFERYIEYRAALWSLDPARAMAHAKLMRERLVGVHESFAYPLIGALIAEPRLLVLDRPQAAYASAMLAVARGRAIFSTHTGVDEAAAWA